jgi:hypothetical protein
MRQPRPRDYTTSAGASDGSSDRRDRKGELMPDPQGPVDRLISDLFREDELGVVVRAHIHIEARLLELLALLVTDTNYLDKMNLEFSQRVNLSVALGLKAEHAPALLALGTLRNRFAHRLDTTLSESTINNLYDALSAGDKTAVQSAYEQTKTQTSPPDIGPFRSLSPKVRFTLISVALDAMLTTAIREARVRQIPRPT